MKRRWLLISMFGILAISAGVFYSIRPTIRPELVGEWQGRMYPGTVYDLRSDGTYASRTVEILTAGGAEQQFSNTGEWRATRSAILLKPLAGDSIVDRRKVPLTPTGKWVSMPIRWNPDGTWQPTDLGMGNFHKVR